MKKAFDPSTIDTTNDGQTLMKDFIHLARPNISDAEIDAVVSVLKSGQLSLGPKLPEFEARFAETCGTRYAVGVSSGTAGLHLLVRAMNIASGDEVITTPFSFVASANCALMEGARPVFVDVDPATWNIDPSLIDGAVTDRTRAIIPVHVFGQPTNMNAITATARKHGLKIIEDACEALGSQYHGAPAGSLGDAGVFGFYPNKQITTGEGGMITTNDASLAVLCRSLRNQGRDTNGGWLAHPRMGYNYRLNDIACALGIEQLVRLNEIVAERTRVEAWYRERLGADRRLVMQSVADGIDMSWFVLVVRLADDYQQSDRDGMLRDLQERGIGCSNYFVPIHLQPFYREQFGYGTGDFPVCESLAARTMALPFHHELSEGDVDRICRELLSLL
ncbi:MAG: DegT/DnrJ/EryC1/StrS family aminotransferase [Planctomycetota bacterium]|jgi:perosamine synthetase